MAVFRDREYRAWINMRDRCSRESHPAYRRYGGRGIRVCERWASFANFIADMGPCPPDRVMLDRIDNDGNYEPENCRWTDAATQNRNRSNLIWITYRGETRLLQDWAQRTGMRYGALYGRLRGKSKGRWTIEEALETPVTRKNCSRREY